MKRFAICLLAWPLCHAEVRTGRFQNRDSWVVDTPALRVSIMQSGGHVAEIVLKGGGEVNPLWVQNRPTLDAEQYDPGKHEKVYGGKGQDARVAGLFTLMGSTPQKIARAEAGETVALGKLDNMATGETISTVKGTTKQLIKLDVSPGVYGLAISVADRKDEVKLTSAVTKLIEEDPSLSLEQNQSTHEMVLWGQGEMHLRVALERLMGKFGIQAHARPRRIDYRETIRKSVQVREISNDEGNRPGRHTIATDRAQLAEWVDAGVAAPTPEIIAREYAWRLRDYGIRLIAEKRKNLTDDIMSTIIRAQLDPEDFIPDRHPSSRSPSRGPRSAP